MASAVFVGPNNSEPTAAIRAEVRALTQVTTGDLLYVGQVFRSRIRQRTFEGRDVNGAPFAGYSGRGPYYFYPNAGAAGNVRGRLAPSDRGAFARVAHARRVAAAGRFVKTGNIGVRTPFGIKYASYGAAKAAHGVANVNLYGMEQHTHMLDTIIVRAGGAEAPPADLEALFNTGSDLSVFEQSQPAQNLTVGFYGPEAERARGHNEGTATLPKREFFALNAEDLQLAETAIGQRMMLRAKERRS